MDFAPARDGGDEGWSEPAVETTHLGDGELKGGGHILAGHVTGGEDKFADGVLLESAFFEKVVADAFVCGQ